jgi:1-acyl-sn-glycerol-3-phosphate acyltransferase
VSFVDAIVISAASRRPVRFIMEAAIFRNPALNAIFRGMKAIPVTSATEDRATYETAFATVRDELAKGQLVCIFPEGRLTGDGEIAEFRPGMMKILKETPVPVVPLAISGLWGSMFSRFETATWRRLPRKLLARITLTAGASIAPSDVTPERLRVRIAELRGATP